jgi:orotate phosphoribosyltransferase
MRSQNWAPCTKSKFSAVSSQGSELDPCLAWVQRERKAATNEAKFGAHFTQIVRFSALVSGQSPNTAATPCKPTAVV